ncbi:VPLPA-CTERM sorting domain-containing protein [Frigidibacter sp. MR17.24]|uniref:VPLPA-CTERM sorting domain-containing protein n=1 Tax=Frigidibacter sp. MR17.24 TaxID=3127345 RepID=UPI0030130B2A
MVCGLAFGAFVVGTSAAEAVTLATFGMTESFIEDSMGESLLGAVAIGSGAVFMGTMTTTNYHFMADADLLRSNILQYAAAGAVTPAPVPLPAGAPLLITALAGLAAMRRRHRT